MARRLRLQKAGWVLILALIAAPSILHSQFGIGFSPILTGSMRPAMAKSRLEFGNKSRPDGKNYTETQKEDEALVSNHVLAEAHALDKAKVEVYKGKINVLKAQSDLVRSVMVSVRTSMEMEGIK